MSGIELAKSYDLFQPEKCEGAIHIIGCGSIGSTVAEELARYGITNIRLYDFDTVEPHNLNNQSFRQQHIGILKTEALASMLYEINPEIEKHIKLYPEGYTDQNLSGYVFLCVDSIELRRQIVTDNRYNKFIKAMFDFRTRLTDAQHWAADWNDYKMVEAFLKSMSHSDEEARAETPVSACNTTLCARSTVTSISAFGVFNFVNFVNTGQIKKAKFVDLLQSRLDAF